MGKVENKKFNSILKNERGVTMISNAVVSGLFIVIITLFGETVATCYQFISLQHAANLGVRAGIVNTINPEIGQCQSQIDCGKSKTDLIAKQLHVNYTGQKSAFVSSTNYQSEVTSDGKWISVQITKRLDFSKVLNLIGGDTGRGFDFSIQTKAALQPID